MDGLKPGRLIKYGFWFGIGLILPMLLHYVLTMAAGAMMAESMVDNNIMEEEFSKEGFMSGVPGGQIVKNLQLVEHRETKINNQLIVLGKVHNTGTIAANNVQIEVELFDAQGAFVFECSGYIPKTIQPDGSENFQVNCGCGDQAPPSYSNLTVSVVSAYGV